MSNIPDLGKMVGPLPLGAWIAVVGGGFAFMAYNRKQNDVTAADTTGTDTPLNPADVTSGDNVGTGGSGQWVDLNPPSDTGVAPAITDNESWGVAAVNWLIAQGYDPAISDSAIRKYLDQEKAYSTQEYALVKLALGHLGSPPSPLPAPVFGAPPPTGGKGGTTKPHPKPPTKPHPKPPVHKPHIRYYRVKPGDSLSKIGRKYHVSYQSIYNANRKGHKRADNTPGMISNPNIIHVGWKLIIPN